MSDGRAFFSEEKRHTPHQVTYLAKGVPAYRLTNTCVVGRYRLEKVALCDPQRDVILQQVRFTPLQGERQNYHLYALLAPHLGNQGAGNSGWVDAYKGYPMLIAQHEGWALALLVPALGARVRRATLVSRMAGKILANTSK